MYVIAGVTGNTGKVAANALLDAGKKVRVVVRDAKKAEPFAARGAEVAVADLGDGAALTKALAGATGAYVLLPPNPAAPDFRAYQDALSATITQAIAAAKVPHVVLLSSIAAELPGGTGPIAGLHVFEDRLRALGTTKSTFLRAGYFMENLASSLGAVAQGIFPSMGPGDVGIDMVATEDIGELAAKLLMEGARETSVVNLGGPSVTMRDVASIASKITGKEIALQEIPLDAVAPTLESFGFPAGLAKLYREMIGAFGDGTIRWEAGHRHLQGKTSIEAFLRRALA